MGRGTPITGRCPGRGSVGFQAAEGEAGAGRWVGRAGQRCWLCGLLSGSGTRVEAGALIRGAFVRFPEDSI